MPNRIFLTQLSDFPAEGRKVFQVEGVPVLVIKTGEQFRAVTNKCPHLGLPLAGGKVESETITCPFHGSKFDLNTGENLDWVNSFLGLSIPGWSRRLLEMGKKPAPLHTFPVVVEDGKLFVEI
ncbi:MAG: Rieske (2Fe-2S) protein [Anaerolineales bacterium]